MMYCATTRAIEVQVTPEFMADRSSPNEGHYFWAYTIVIANRGPYTVQLKTRHWRITDAHGKTEEVRGPGVVGKTPVLDPGESFTYTSGCPLGTASGIMVGSYQMQLQDGSLIDVAIPAFSLDSPFAIRSVN
jgi:ApaG protein